MGALSDAFVWHVTSVCLSVTYIGHNSRTERHRKTKIGTEVANITRDSDTTFKVKRSKVKVTRPLWLLVLAGQHGHTVMVTYPYAYMTYIVSPLAGLVGGISWRPPAYSLLFANWIFVDRPWTETANRVYIRFRYTVCVWTILARRMQTAVRWWANVKVLKLFFGQILQISLKRKIAIISTA